MWQNKGGSRRVVTFLRESILIDFDFIWKVLLSDRNFATLLDPLLQNVDKRMIVILLQDVIKGSSIPYFSFSN